MKRQLVVSHTRDRLGAPRAVVSGFPGTWAEFSAFELRELASLLDQIAEDVEARPAGAPNERPEVKTYARSDA